MMLCGFFRVMNGVQVMTMRYVRVMAGLFMAPACMMLGRFFVMTGRVFMMFRRFNMVFRAFFAHKEIIEDYCDLGGLQRLFNLTVTLVVAGRRSK